MRNPHLVRLRGGPYPHLRGNSVTKVTEGLAVLQLVAGGATFRQAANTLGMSLTTAWRRYWFVMDWDLPRYYGRPCGPVPPQRGTRACPSGRPWLPTLDGDGWPR